VVVSGKWVGFCVEANTVEARGRSRVGYGGLVFDVGDVVSLDVNTMTLRAVGAVVRRDKATVEAESLSADLQSGEILVQRLVEGAVVRQRLSADTLTVIDSEQAIPPGTFTMPDIEGQTWFVGSSVRVFPGEKIVLRGATIYAGVEKVLSLPPYWVLALPGFAGASNSSMLNVGQSGNVTFDLPFFLQVTDTWTAAVRLQRGSSISTVSAQQGWSLALHEEYATVSGTRGYMTLSGIPTGEWGLAWHDNRSVLGSSESYTDLSLPDHKSTFFTTSLYTPRSRYMQSLSANFDRPQDYAASYGAAAEWLAYPRRLLGSSCLNYSLGTSVSFRHGPSYSVAGDSKGSTGDTGSAGTASPVAGLGGVASGTPQTSATTSATATTGETTMESVFGHEVYGALGFRPYSLGGSWGLEPRLQNVFAWYSNHTQQDSLRAELGLSGRVGRPNYLRLVYSAENSSGDLGEPGWRQEVDLYLSAVSGRLSTYVSASRAITDNSNLAMVSSSYQVNNAWRLGSLLTYYRFSESSFSDVELTIGRTFFGQEVGLRWSAETGKLTLQAIGLSRAF
jgi:hypothetical protein